MLDARVVIVLLLPAAAACSTGDGSPTEATPALATACASPKPRISASPAAVTRPSGTRSTAQFVATNNCAVSLSGWTLTSSRTGAVGSVGAPSRSSLPTLSPGQSVDVSVPYRVGAPGTGSVVLLATSRAGQTSFGYLWVTVVP